jgi:hypothetical protein
VVAGTVAQDELVQGLALDLDLDLDLDRDLGVG